MRRAAAIATLLAHTGCIVSAIGVRGAPSDVPIDQEPRCSTSYAAPVVDTHTALLGAALAIGPVVDPSAPVNPGEDWNIGASDGFVIGLGLVMAVPSVLSALWGYSQIYECRELRAKHRAWADGSTPPAPPTTTNPYGIRPIPD
jgi:hypothetical protein